MNLRSLWKGLAGAILLAAFLSNCTKIKTTDIGTDLLPAVDNVKTFDTTLEVITTNYLFGDSALPHLGRATNNSVSPHMLGLITNDPQFGASSAAIYSEFKPSFYPYYFEAKKDSIYLDSAVLCLRWNFTWGDTDRVQKVNVYRMTDLLRGDSAYPTNTTIRYSTLIGTRTFAPSILDDSIPTQREGTLTRQLRIRLSDDFGRFLIAQDTAPGSPYYNDTLFRQFFNGYAIVPQAGDGGNALMAFTPSDTGSYVNLYYRYMYNGKMDTTFRKMKMDNGANGAHANVIHRDHSGSEITQHLNRPIGGDSLVYIQTAPGSYAKVDMSSMNGFVASKGNVIIHRAELYTQQVASVGQLDNLLLPPTNLYIDYFDTDSSFQRPFYQDAFSGFTFLPGTFGGGLKYVPDANGNLVAEYRFDIARYMQGIVTRGNKINMVFLYAPYAARYSTASLSLSVPINSIADGRVKVGGGNLHGPQKMRLRVVYSKL